MAARERRRHRVEYLVFRGRLRPDLEFELRHSYSTDTIQRSPRVEPSEYHVELRDERENTLIREPAEIVPSLVCEPGAAIYSRVRAYVPLREGAHEILFLRGTVAIRSFRVPEKPRLSLEWSAKRVTRGRRQTLRLAYSGPQEGAFLQLVYQWGVRRFQTLGFFQPRREMSLDFRDLPGGKRCRIVVLYSNGLRSVGEATRYFALPPMRPTVEILRPREGQVLSPWTPVELEAGVDDPDNGPARDDDLVWLLDGEEVCRGYRASLENLSEGEHRVGFRYQRDTTPIESSCTIRVRRPKRHPGTPGSEWQNLDAS